MSIKVMIIDDEKIIRNGLINEFPWASHDMQVVAEACNGFDGLDTAIQVKPDIVITDIRMPGLSGLEMAQKIKESNPSTNLIFISGYSDFNYAKQAINLEADSYLLKPINFEELQAALRKIVNQRKNLLQEHDKQQYRELLLNNSLPFLRAKLLRDFASEDLSYESFLKEAPFVELDLHDGIFQIAIIEFDDILSNLGISSEQRNSILGELERTVKNQQLREASTTIAYTAYNTIVILESKADEKQLQYFWESLKEAITKNLGEKVTVGISKAYPEAKYLGLQLKQATRELLKLSKTETRDRQGNEITLLYPSKEEEQLLISTLNAESHEPLSIALDSLISRYIEPHEKEIRTVKTFCINLLAIGMRQSSDIELFQSEDFEVFFSEDNFHSESISIPLLCNQLKQLFFRIAEQSGNEKPNKRYPPMIVSAIRLAKERYAEGIQVQEIANYLEVTPNYLSSTFKQAVGINFTDWLTEYRIVQAKRLLLENPQDKVYEIAEKVGFGNYKYFVFIFKRLSGHTPMLYRKLMIQGDTL
jgi:two-component system response regulator YesN